jgi:rubrerythrin
MSLYQRRKKHNDNRNFNVITLKDEKGHKVLYKRSVKEKCPICRCTVQNINGKKYCFICDKKVDVTIV